MRYINYIVSIVLFIVIEHFALQLFDNNSWFATSMKTIAALLGLGLFSIILSGISVAISKSGKDSVPWIVGLIETKSYFEYKNKKYFTVVGEREVHIYKESFFVHILVGKFYDSDNRTEYQKMLISRIDYYEKSILDLKLKNKFKKNKYNDFNQLN